MTVNNTGDCFGVFFPLSLPGFVPPGPQSLLAWLRASTVHMSLCRWSAGHIPACLLGSSQKWLNHSLRHLRSSSLLHQAPQAPRSDQTWTAFGRTQTSWTRCTCALERCDRQPEGWHRGCCPFHQPHRGGVGSVEKTMTVKHWVSRTSWIVDTKGKINILLSI